MDKRRTKGERTRQGIIEATKSILDQEGFKSLTTRSIAQKAGISQSSLYHHFNGVEEILFAALTSAANVYLDVEHIRKFDNLKDYFLHLFEFADPAYSHNNCQAGYFSIMEKAMFDDKFRRKLTTMSKTLIDNLKKNISSLYGDKLDQKKLDLVVFAFFTFREGFIIHNQIYRDESPFGQTKQKAYEVFNLFNNFLEESLKNNEMEDS